MPISEVYQAMAFDQAVGILREGERSGEYVRGYTTSRTLSDVSRRLLGHNENVPGATIQAYRAVAQRALQSLNAVDALASNPSAALGRGAVPVNPTNLVGTDRYIYKTVLRIDDGTGRLKSAVNYVTNDAPLSYNDVIQQARDRIDVIDVHSRSSLAAVALLSTGATVRDVVLVSVQRTR